MGKVKWGTGITAAAIDEVDTDKQFTPYEGPTPPNGVYRFHVKVLKQTTSSNNNPQLAVGLELTPREDIPEQRRFKGYFCMDWIPVMDSTAFRLRPFLDAIGVTSKEFINGTITDEDKNVTKIGKLAITKKLLVAASIRMGQDQKGNARMEVGTYIPVVDGDDQDADADAGYNADEEPPF